MDDLNLDTIEDERTRPIPFETPSGEVRFIVKVSTPKLLARWRQFVLSKGICGKDMDVKSGQFKEFCRSLADHFVVGWEGAIKPEGTPYSAEKMAGILENRLAVMQGLQKSITEDETFFGSNGNGQP